MGRNGSERVGGIVVRSAQVRKVLKIISRLSPYKATVLIHGESGTGKEMVARALHRLGSVPSGPFVPVEGRVNWRGQELATLARGPHSAKPRSLLIRAL